LLAEHGIEAAQALEPARVRHAGHGKVGVHEQALREQQPLGAREIERRDAHATLQGPSHVALADAQVPRQVRYAVPVERARGDALHRGLGQLEHDVDHRRAAGRQLGSAAQTRPESRTLGGRRRLEKPAVLAGRLA
jgi:hypothetical protein